MNLENETRDGYLVKSETKKIWQVQLDLAKRLIEVCKAHNLRVWAAAGTLLGVVRHKGFIPWDDDMDFVMLREDYDKLLKLADDFPEPYFLQSALNERGYSRGHAQLRNSQTSAILPADIWQSFNQGIFIDIFVVDDMPDDVENWPRLIEGLQKRLMELRFRAYTTFATKDLSVIWRLLKSWLRFNCKTIKHHFIETENIAKSWDKGKKGLIADVMFSPYPYKTPIRCRQWYDETLWMPFEDMLMPVPWEYDKELRACFGDNYMTPLRSGMMHGSVIFDTKKPYKEKLQELRKGLSLKQRIKGIFVPGI